MSEKADANKGSMKRNHLILLIVGMLALWLLFVFDVPIWQAARDLVEPDFLYIPELFTHYGLYLFYLILGAVFIYAIARKNRNLITFCLAYVKTQLPGFCELALSLGCCRRNGHRDNGCLVFHSQDPTPGALYRQWADTALGRHDTANDGAAVK